MVQAFVREDKAYSLNTPVKILAGHYRGKEGRIGSDKPKHHSHQGKIPVLVGYQNKLTWCRPEWLQPIDSETESQAHQDEVEEAARIMLTLQATEYEEELLEKTYLNLPDNDIWATAWEITQGLGYEYALVQVKEALNKLADQGKARSSLDIGKNEVLWQKDLPSSTCAVGSELDFPSPDESLEDLNSSGCAKTTSIAETFLASDFQASESTQTFGNSAGTTNQLSPQLLETGEEGSMSLQPARPVSRSRFKESAKEATTGETAFQQLSKSHASSSQDSSALKTSEDSSAAPTSQEENPSIFNGSLPGFMNAGMMWNGLLLAQDTLTPPSLESDSLWLESPGALSHNSDTSRPPGQSKLDAQLKAQGAIKTKEVVNPEFLESSFGLPLGWTDPQENRSALELLAETQPHADDAQPWETALTPELQNLHSEGFSTSTLLADEERSQLSSRFVKSVSTTSIPSIPSNLTTDADPQQVSDSDFSQICESVGEAPDSPSGPTPDVGSQQVSDSDFSQICESVGEAPVQVMMSAAETKHRLELIKAGLDNISAHLLAIDEQRGWEALDYKSMHEMIKAELKEHLKKSVSQIYRKLSEAKIRRELSQICEKVDEIPAYKLEPLGKLPPGQWQETWQEAVSTAPDGRVDKSHVQTVVSRRLQADLRPGDWVEVCSLAHSLNGLRGMIVEPEDDDGKLGIDLSGANGQSGRWRFSDRELVKVSAPLPYKAGEIVTINCDRSSTPEQWQHNRCWGVVREVLEFTVMVGVGGGLVQYSPRDLDWVDAPDDTLKSVCDRVTQLQSVANLPKSVQHLLKFYQRELIFSQGDLDVLKAIEELYQP